MPQAMPIIRTLSLRRTYPRWILIALFTEALHLAAPPVPVWVLFLCMAFGLSAVFAEIQRVFTRHHRSGITAYKAGRFEESLGHFEASHRYFIEHPKIDAWRAWWGVASTKSYRQIAVLNMAYACAQMGDGPGAKELFEKVLGETPDDSNARFGLNMLGAGAKVAAVVPAKG